MPIVDIKEEFLASCNFTSSQSVLVEVPSDDDNSRTNVDSFLQIAGIIYEQFIGQQAIIDQIGDLQGLLLKNYNSIDAAELKHLCHTYKQNALLIMQKTKELQQLADDATNSGDASDSEQRIYVMHITAIKQKTADFFFRFGSTQDKYRTICKDNIKRHILEAGVEGKQTSQSGEELTSDVFLQTLIPDLEVSKDVIDSLQARHKHLKTIEQSLQKLKDLYTEVAIIVDEEAESTTRIRSIMQLAKSKVRHAEKDIKTSTRLQKSSRYSLCVFGTVLVILIIVIIIVAVSLSKN